MYCSLLKKLIIWKILFLETMQFIEGKEKTVTIKTTEKNPESSMMRIVKGNIAKIEDYPYLIDLTYDNEPMCGGSIISPQWVLTAGHCVANGMTLELKKFKVGVGHRHQGKGKSYKVAKVVVHDLYEGQEHDLYADLSMIKIKGKFEFSKTVQAVKLNKSGKKRDDQWGGNCTAAGWGLNQVNGNLEEHPDQFLRSVKMKIVDADVCDQEWPYLFRASICAIGSFKGSGTCSGDSGAPLVCNGLQVGILSFGTMDCVPTKSEIYTRVSSFHDWIKATMANDKKKDLSQKNKNKPKPWKNNGSKGGKRPKLELLKSSEKTKRPKRQNICLFDS